MATLNIQQALDRAKADPNSQFATWLRQQIDSGSLDEAAANQGVDLSPLGRPKQKQSFLDGISEAIQASGEDVAQTFESGQQAQAQGKQSSVLTGLQTAASGARGLFRTAGAGIKGLFGAKGQENIEKAGQKVGEVFQKGTEKLSETNLFQRAGQQLVELEKTDPEKAQLVMNILSGSSAIGDIADLALAGQGTAALGESIKRGVSRGVRQISESEIMKGFRGTPVEVQQALSDSFVALPESELVPLKQGIVKSYKTAFVDDRVSINNKLNKLAKRNGKSKDELLQDLANEGITPSVNGKMADMNPAIEMLDRRIGNFASQLDETLKPFDVAKPINDLKQQTLNAIRTDSRFPAGQIEQGSAFVEKTFENYRLRYGDSLTPRQMNELRAELNRQFKEGFEIDAAQIVGDTMRKNIDELTPVATEANAEIGRLIQLRNTASIFNNTPIDIGVLGGQLGRMVGAMGAGVAGAGAFGPGGLVVSGIAAHYGGNIIAQLLRSRKFSKQAKQILEQAIRNDQSLLKKLQDTADAEARKYLERYALPAPREGAPQSQINVAPELPTRSLPDEPGVPSL